ncbi:MAG: PilZ domain-containing protein [Planctomycetota bacterium]|nr:MAG: PilZ domain-containing protein [Planctomycetota bacterium]REK30755.1 MAG: PilZ domain-containing protein [Planctomycetota bacterium]REK33130.1 MAG: PilZ domain-containing protein [Planctomycetota bacterium]
MTTAGPAQTLTIEDLDALLDGEHREHGRIDHRARIQVISLSADRTGVRPVITLGWTEDVSAGGAKLLIDASLAPSQFWIRIPESARRNQFVECRVRWSETGHGLPNGHCRCGVEFQRILSREEFDEVLSCGTFVGDVQSQPRSIKPPAH